MTTLEIKKLGISGQAVFRKMILWGWITSDGVSISPSQHLRWRNGDGQLHNGSRDMLFHKRSFNNEGRRASR